MAQPPRDVEQSYGSLHSAGGVGEIDEMHPHEPYYQQQQSPSPRERAPSVMVWGTVINVAICGLTAYFATRGSVAVDMGAEPALDLATAPVAGVRSAPATATAAAPATATATATAGAASLFETGSGSRSDGMTGFPTSGVGAKNYGSGPIGSFMQNWEESVAEAGGITPYNLTDYIVELESILPAMIEASAQQSNNCTCDEHDNCYQLQTSYPTEQGELMGYGGGDWEDFFKMTPKVTTLVLGAYSDSTWSEDMICRAHANGVRVLLDNPSGFGSKFEDSYEFDNVTYIADWISQRIDTVAQHYADGFGA